MVGQSDVRPHGNVAALPYDDESFDKVIAVETLYFWPDPVANLKEVHRILKPGGLVALAMEGSTESPDQQEQIAPAARMEFPICSGAETVEMLTAAGFSRGWLCAQGAK